eukprot:5037251-Prorocentrum_lima.AAC.1
MHGATKSRSRSYGQVWEMTPCIGAEQHGQVHIHTIPSKNDNAQDTHTPETLNHATSNNACPGA